MKIAAVAVRRRITFLMIYLSAVGFGIFSLTRLGLDMYPDISFPLVAVIVQYRGAAPQDIEQLVTRPLEEACASVEGVEEISSESKFGASVLMVNFEWGTNIREAEQDIRKNIDMFWEQLPQDAESPLIFSFDPSMQPVIFFGISGPYDQARLRQISESNIEPQIERIPGVAMAETIGGLKREIQVRIRPEQLRAVNLSPMQIVNALRSENLDIPGGSTQYGKMEYSILPKGQFHSVDEIREIPVTVRQGTVIKLSDVADVVDTFHEETRIIRVNGKPGIMLLIRKQSGANSVEVAGNVIEQLPGIEKRLPRGMKMNIIFNQADFINESLGNLGSTAVIAVILSAFVLLFFLRNIRAALIVSTAIPVSAVLTFAAMDQSDMSLNIISLAGIALAVGMLLDNSIVVLESIFRYVEMGEKPHVAAVKGTGEVGMAITASTLTTIAVFAPVLFVPGIAGAMFRDMAATICFSLTISLIVALTLIPLGASVMLEREGAEKKKRSVGGWILWVIFLPVTLPWFIISRTLGWALGRFSDVFLKAITAAYRALLNQAMNHRVITFVLAILLLAGSVFLATQIKQDFFPKEDQSMTFFQLKTEVGTHVESTDTYARQAEKIIEKTVPEMEVVSADIGVGDGFGAMFGEGSHAALFRIRLIDKGTRERSQEEIEKALRDAFKEIPGATVDAFMPFNLTGGSDLEIKIVGHDLDTARSVGMKVKNIVESDPDAADVMFSLDEGRPEYHVIYDRQRLAALGLPASAPSSVISTFFQGTIATVYREEGEDYYVLVRAPKEVRKDPRALENLLIQTPSGKSVPLSSIAKIKRALGPTKVTRLDQKRVVTVSASSTGGDLGGLTSRIQEKLDKFPWPEGFGYRIGGTAEDLMESFMYLGIALIVALILVYMVMASQFESLLEPFIIFITIPFSLIGSALVVDITGIPISVTAIIGQIMLIGIVVNNAIVFVDYANRMMEKGMDRLEAVIETGRVRMRPILMTALTTIFSMLPLALEIGTGAESWSPLARVIMGGLFVSTFITLLVVPVLFYWFVGMTKRGKGLERPRLTPWENLNGSPDSAG